jgi:hypothetical protein
MNASPRNVFRLTTLAFALLLLIESAWLLLAQIFHPSIDRLPTNATAAATIISLRDRAIRAASIGSFRGQLWAEAAFTYSALFWTAARSQPDPKLAQEFAKAREIIERALNDAPAQPGVWLLRAELAIHYPELGINKLESIKMSYYTGPSEQDLMPLRLLLAVSSDASKDPEIGQLVSRDLRLLLARRDRAAIAEAYDQASPEGRQFIESTIGNLDASAREWLRAHTEKHSRNLSD